MKRSLPSLLLVAALAAPTMTARAQAASCLPDTAERVLEELLEAAPDDSPLQEQARTIADEQDDRGAFESDETIRRLDEAAVTAGYFFDCGTSRFVRSGGTPTTEDNNDDVASTYGTEPVAGTKPDSGSSAPPTTRRSTPGSGGGQVRGPGGSGTADGMSTEDPATGEPATARPATGRGVGAARAGSAAGKGSDEGAQAVVGRSTTPTEALAAADEAPSGRSTPRPDDGDSEVEGLSRSPLWLFALALSGLATGRVLVARRRRCRQRI